MILSMTDMHIFLISDVAGTKPGFQKVAILLSKSAIPRIPFNVIYQAYDMLAMEFDVDMSDCQIVVVKTASGTEARLETQVPMTHRFILRALNRQQKEGEPDAGG